MASRARNVLFVENKNKQKKLIFPDQINTEDHKSRFAAGFYQTIGFVTKVLFYAWMNRTSLTAGKR